MKAPLLVLLLGFLHSFAHAGPPPDEVMDRLTAAIREHSPDAKIEAAERGFTAKAGTMIFTLHRRSKTGEVFAQTDQREGPNFRGFMLSVSLLDGPYQGAAATPQTLKEPYFSTFLDARPAEGGRKHYWITFSYGGRLDERLKTAILEALPKE